MDRLSSISTLEINEKAIPMEHSSIETVHLNVVNLKASTEFWMDIIGLQLIKSTPSIAYLGSQKNVLIVIHQSVTLPFLKGYRGFYHYSINIPDKCLFAALLQRLIINEYPFTPVDNVLSKSIYLNDPDGINVEIKLETPERFKQIVAQDGLKIQDINDTIRNASNYLDINEVLMELKDEQTTRPEITGTTIIQFHFYANYSDSCDEFYAKIGLSTDHCNDKFEIIKDGKRLKHQLSIKTSKGTSRPLAQENHAGMRHLQIAFDSKKHLKKVLNELTTFEEKENGYWLNDPTGTKIKLTLK